MLASFDGPQRANPPLQRAAGTNGLSGIEHPGLSSACSAGAVAGDGRDIFFSSVGKHSHSFGKTFTGVLSMSSAAAFLYPSFEVLSF